MKTTLVLFALLLASSLIVLECSTGAVSQTASQLRREVVLALRRFQFSVAPPPVLVERIEASYSNLIPVDVRTVSWLEYEGLSVGEYQFECFFGEKITVYFRSTVKEYYVLGAVIRFEPGKPGAYYLEKTIYYGMSPKSVTFVYNIGGDKYHPAGGLESALRRWSRFPSWKFVVYVLSSKPPEEFINIVKEEGGAGFWEAWFEKIEKKAFIQVSVYDTCYVLDLGSPTFLQEPKWQNFIGRTTLEHGLKMSGYFAEIAFKNWAVRLPDGSVCFTADDIRRLVASGKYVESILFQSIEAGCKQLFIEIVDQLYRTTKHNISYEGDEVKDGIYVMYPRFRIWGWKSSVLKMRLPKYLERSRDGVPWATFLAVKPREYTIRLGEKDWYSEPVNAVLCFFLTGHAPAPYIFGDGAVLENWRTSYFVKYAQPYFYLVLDGERAVVKASVRLLVNGKPVADSLLTATNPLTDPTLKPYFDKWAGVDLAWSLKMPESQLDRIFTKLSEIKTVTIELTEDRLVVGEYEGGEVWEPHRVRKFRTPQVNVIKVGGRKCTVSFTKPPTAKEWFELTYKPIGPPVVLLRGAETPDYVLSGQYFEAKIFFEKRTRRRVQVFELKEPEYHVYIRVYDWNGRLVAEEHLVEKQFKRIPEGMNTATFRIKAPAYTGTIPKYFEYTVKVEGDVANALFRELKLRVLVKAGDVRPVTESEVKVESKVVEEKVVTKISPKVSTTGRLEVLGVSAPSEVGRGEAFKVAVAVKAVGGRVAGFASIQGVGEKTFILQEGEKAVVTFNIIAPATGDTAVLQVSAGRLTEEGEKIVDYTDTVTVKLTGIEAGSVSEPSQAPAEKPKPWWRTVIDTIIEWIKRLFAPLFD